MNEDKAVRYHRLKRRVSVASAIWSAGLLSLLLWTGGSGWLRDLAGAASAALLGEARRPLVVVLYLFCLLALHEIGDLLLGFYGGFVLERRYGLSTQTVRGWVLDQAKSLALTSALGAGAVSLIYWTMRLTPGLWWLLAGALFALLFAVLAGLAPILLLPLFYTIKPLTRDALRVRLLTLAERAGARILDAYEWGLGEKTRAANAALAGLGSTRRILVSDTMLADYSDEEIEVVLAHELAHHVHGDMWKGLAFHGALMIAAFFVAASVLNWSAPRLGLSGADDVAGLPLLLLAAGAVSLVTLPAAHAMTRAHERSADRFALELTRNPSAFISAMRRLAAQNLAEERPSRVVQWLFYSHPPLTERIAAAHAFRL